MLPSGTAIVLVGLKTTDAGRGYGRAAGSAKRSTAPRLQRLTTERQDAPSSGNAEIVSQLSLRRSVGVTFGLEGSMDAFRILDEGELSIHPLPGLGDLVCGLGRFRVLSSTFCAALNRSSSKCSTAPLSSVFTCVGSPVSSAFSAAGMTGP